MLHVADKLVGPVEEINRAVRSHVHSHGAKVRVVRFHQVLERLAFQTRAVLADLHAEDALKANDVAVQKISLPVVRKVPAVNQARAGAGTRGAFPEFLHVRVLRRVFEVAAEGGSEVAVVAGRVGDDVSAPVIKHAPVRVGEAVGNVALKLVSARLEAIDAGVHVAHRAVRRLNLRAMEHAVAEVGRAAGIEHHRVGRVVRIGGVHAHEHPFLPVGVPVAVRVAHEPQVGRLHDEHAVLVELEPGRAIQTVEEMDDLVRLAVAVGVFKDKQAVARFAGRGPFGIIPPRGNPKASFGIKIHLHGIDEFGELLFAREEARFTALGQGHVVDGLFRIKIRTDILLVRFQRIHERKHRIIHFHVAALRHGPDAFVPIFGLHIALRHFLLHHVVIGNHRAFLAGAREGQLGTAAINVVTVHGAIARMPLVAFVRHRGAEFFKMVFRRGFVEERFEDFRRQRLVACFGEKERVERERLCLLRRFRVKPLRHGEDVHKEHVIRLGHVGHGRRVELEVGVVRLRIGQVGIIDLFVGDGREEHDARRAFAAVILRPRIFEKLVEVALEFVDPSRSLERFVEAVKGENHIRLCFRQPVIARAEVFRPVPRRHLIARGGEVAENEIVPGKLRVDKRLEPGVVLHPVGQRVAEVTDVVALVKCKLRAECIGAERNEKDEQAGQVFHGFNRLR